MNHPKREEWIPLLFGEADAETKQRLETHLRSCAACAAEVNAWKRTMGRLDAWKLPKAQRPAPTLNLQPVAWAAAAAIVIAAFAVGRVSAPAIDAAALRAELKSELSSEIQQSLMRASLESSNALAGIETRIAAATASQSRLLADEFVQVINTLRRQDREATEALFTKLQDQYTTDFMLLPRDLETVASFTDDQIRSARQRLFEIAAAQQSQQP
jgi:hypothetical protein